MPEWDADEMAAFFDIDLGVSATYTHGGVPATITVIFDNAFVAVEGVESLGPAATCKTSDVASAAHGDTLVIGGVTYNITGVHPDGTGITILMLSRD